MEASKNSLGPIPEFSAISAKTNVPVSLPKEITWESISLADDELILYITEESEYQYITRRPFDESKEYKIILFDYSAS